MTAPARPPERLVDERPWLIPLSPLGFRELTWVAILGVLSTLLLAWAWWPGAVATAALSAGGILFFRDPARSIPDDKAAYLAPADGRVTDIAALAQEEALGGPALKIGIFLSVFDVHINRSPCEGTVRDIRYRPGRFLNAMSEQSSRENESNTLVLDAGTLMGPVLVRQIAGLIARRIVCATAVGSRLAAGQRFGMIKFGSRTELVLPRPETLDVLVRIGDKVRAGETIVARRKVV